MEMPDSLNHMVRPNNTHDKTREIVMTLTLIQLNLRESGENGRGAGLHH